ncbi:MAG: Gx transporter family protein [Candidatus Cloacimonetes bacterium]|nr:Gx transporter family protein [Candidatus Cloacimonadota bacterium]
MKKIDPVVLAFFTAFAITIYVLETLIPKPLPFLKLGLANVVVLLLLWKGNSLAGFIVLLSKCILGGIFTATLLSPMTIISLGAGFAAFGAMYLSLRLKSGLSLLGTSILGATLHNLVQLAIVNGLLLHSTAAWKLLPLLLILGIFTGLITGYLAHLLYQQEIIKKYLE